MNHVFEKKKEPHGKRDETWFRSSKLTNVNFSPEIAVDISESHELIAVLFGFHYYSSVCLKDHTK